MLGDIFVTGIEGLSKEIFVCINTDMMIKLVFADNVQGNLLYECTKSFLRVFGFFCQKFKIFLPFKDRLEHNWHQHFNSRITVHF